MPIVLLCYLEAGAAEQVGVGHVVLEPAVMAAAGQVSVCAPTSKAKFGD